MPEPTGPTWKMANRLAGGRLAAIIRRRRSSEPPTTFEQIARELQAEHGIEVTDSTIRNWARRLEIA